MHKLLYSKFTIENFNSGDVTTTANQTTTANPGFTVDGSNITIHNDTGMGNFNKKSYTNGNGNGPYHIHIGESVTNIPDEKFITIQINGLTFDVNGSLNSIGNYAFYNEGDNLSSIENLQIPKTVETIGDSAFDYVKITNDSVNLFDVNGSLNSIGDYAFFNDYTNHLSSIVNLKIPSTVETIGYGAFQYVKITNDSVNLFDVDGSLNSIGAYAFYNDYYNDYYNDHYIEPLNEDNIFAFRYLGFKYAFFNHIKDNSYLSSIKNLRIPKTVETIGRAAFSGVKITNDSDNPLFVDGILNSIGEFAFFNYNIDNLYLSSIVNLQIPSTVVTIGNDAFGYVKITNKSKKPLFVDGSLNSIGHNAFYNYNNDNLYLSSIVNLQIPIENVTIGGDAFKNFSYCNTNLDNDKYGAEHSPSLCPQTTTANQPPTNEGKTNNTLLIIILLLLAVIGGVIYFTQL